MREVDATNHCNENNMDILLVDDEPDHLHMMEMFVRDLGHDPIGAADGRIAWELWREKHPRIVVTDWFMAGMDGLELCRNIRSRHDRGYTYLVLVSQQGGPNAVAEGLESGVDDYIAKPLRMREFQARLENGVRIVNLETELSRRYDAFQDNYFQTIRMFGNLMEVFDTDLGGHARRTADVALELCRSHPEVTESDHRMIETAALLHDIGMIGMPLTIRHKSRAERNEEETRQYRSHPVIGQSLLEEIDFLVPVAQLVRMHHEQHNGRGFPDGVTGGEIPVGARIIAAASTYDNLISRGKISLREIPEKLYRMRDYQLDPAVVDLLLEINSRRIVSEGRRDYMDIAIDDLVEGMVLSRDVRRENGALLLPARFVITASAIAKLKRHCRIACIDTKVSVFKDSLRG